MNLFTSNYRLNGKHPKAVGISLGVPPWFNGRLYRDLNPPAFLLKGHRSEAEYTRLYQSLVLAKLDPKVVAEELGDGAIMLCWEKPGEFCHRRLVAEWLESNLKIVVPEMQPPDPDHKQLGFEMALI
ncbi:MAG: hypothetical protein PHV74_00275 [Dehalococcoidia bacterium]|nr:hypothetical protein [Dehalococcoidia bacterium]